jgi:hypothetical protein
MLNPVFLEMMALEKFKENLRDAQKERLVASLPRDSSPSVWKRILSWAFAGEPGDRKPARV